MIGIVSTVVSIYVCYWIICGCIVGIDELRDKMKEGRAARKSRI